MKAFSQTDKTPAPVALKKTVSREFHGKSLVDDYAWMRDENWKEMFKDSSILEADIRAHLEAENAYQQLLMADTKSLQKTLFSEMKGRIKEDDSTVPAPDGKWAYGSSFVTGGEHPRLFRQPREGGEQTILLDGDLEGEGKAFFQLGSADHSIDHSKLLWGVDDKGSEFYQLRVRDLESGKDLKDVLNDTDGGGAWDANSSGFFYALLDENHRSSKIFYHRLGDQQNEDRLIYAEDDAGFFMSVSESSLHDFIYISIHDHETSECWLLPADNPMETPVLVQARETGVEYDLEEGGDVFYILTNADGAKDFKIVSAPVETPARKNWVDLVPHRSGCLILQHQAYSGFLVRLERENGLPRIVIHDRQSGEEHSIAFEEEAYSLGISGGYEYDTETIRFSYSSMTTPSQLYDYNMRTRERSLLKAQEVPSGHNPDDYETRRVMVPSHDGVQVPVSLLSRKGTELDGSAPCLLYGYGSYGISIPASFSTSCLSLVDRGFIYAIAHIRGGKEKGFSWYEDGKREKKTNTFLDFIAVAEYLDKNKLSAADRIIAQGGSAGGMLMGAIANMAPEVFAGIIAEVPFVDVLNTMLDDTLPLTPPEWPEWGNPIDSATDYAAIAAYSPYDNVSAQAYPPILALAGLTDPRVTYWEPAKWVAKLRELKTSEDPVLFKVNMDSGHAGASGRFSRLEEVAFSYSFALKVVGITQ